MFKNYLTIAIRNLARHKVYSLINIAGLAIGMACCGLILLYVQHEFSYDRFHSKGDRIYRVLRETRYENGRAAMSPMLSGPFVPALKKDSPEIEHAVRVLSTVTRFVQSQDKQFNHHGSIILAAEPDFLRIFDFELIRGDRETALRDPYSVVMREDVAQRYFGAEDPIGKVITFTDGIFQGDHKVTGVVRIPENSSIQFEMVSSLHATMVRNNPFYRMLWENWQPVYALRKWNVFVVLRKGVDLDTLADKLPDFMERYMGKEVRERNTYHLQPLHRMHLYTKMDYGRNLSGDEIQNYGDTQTAYLLLTIACLIMLIACVNFMNLATSRSTNRAKEVGLRKVSGAHRRQLVHQFLGEALLLSFLAFVLALGLVELTLPKFSAFVGKDMMPERSLYHLLAVPGLVCFVGLLAGSYPALFLSAFEPVVVLTGQFKTGLKGTVLRRGLVVFQFAMSILLIIGTATIYRQLNYMQNKNLGFQKSHLVSMYLFGLDRLKKVGDYENMLRIRYNAVKEAFLTHSNVQKATAYRFPMEGSSIGEVGSAGRSGGISRELRTETGETFRARFQEADEDFLETFEIKPIAGRGFQQSDMVGEPEKVLLNEAAVKMLGWKDPIGKQITFNYVSSASRKCTVIGVVENFHYQSLRDKIEPLVIWNRPTVFYWLAFRIRGDDVPETLAFLEQTWKQFLPDRPFEFEFVDESVNRVYRTDQKLAQMVGTFALLAIVVACLGLFGLAAFTAEQRTKEIGVRKILGASVKSIVLLLSTEFAKLVLVANLIAWPVAYFAIGDWLQNFAYRVDVAWWVFALAGVTTLLIALGTVGYQALRAALSNPIDALRYE